ncbi:MAG: hypothetical protein ACRD50_10955 [Candidatus Acidiferrales bacterium]
MKRPTILLPLLAAALLLPLLARAEHTRFWRQSQYSEFQKGTAKGVAIRSDGRLAPAPRFADFSDPNLAYLWMLRLDSKGRLYAAGGSNARVKRIDEKGQAQTVFESPELAAQAITFDAQDNLYVGTSPDGKVYKVTPDGQKSDFFEPKTKYIWSLAMDAHGILFVGTGESGEVFAVGADGKGLAFYKSEERHARTLAFDKNGDLLIGTDPNGLIVRVSVLRTKPGGLPEAGPAFVVYETSKKEVTSLLTDSTGNIFAAAVGAKQRAAPVGPAIVQPPIVQAAPQAVPGEGQVVVTPAAAGTAPPRTVTNFFPFPSLTGGSEVYRIDADGTPHSLWKSFLDLVYGLGLTPSGKLELGTGNHGELVELEGDDLFSVLAQTASAQVTSLVSAPGRVTYVATANPGKIFKLGPGLAPDGSFESEPFDAKIFSQWGRISWWGENGGATGKVSFYVRSGNTSDPGETWSPWAGPYAKSTGEAAQCPPARFVQWKAVFSAPESGDLPDIGWVSLAYLPHNIAPEIDAIVMQNPGIRAQGFPGGAPLGGTAPVQLRMPGSRTPNFAPVDQSEVATEPQQGAHMQAPPQGFAVKGYETVLWSAHDENEDALVFSLYYRGEGEKSWKLLKSDLHQEYYSWDTTTMPDGAYYLRLVASDAPSNPAEDALTAERISDRFEVDNTPPLISNLRAESGSPETVVRFEVQDPQSNVKATEYSLDAGEWQIVFPQGRLTDSPQERYEIALGKLATGEHTVAVRVTDQFENVAAAKATFTAGAAAKH